MNRLRIDLMLSDLKKRSSVRVRPCILNSALFRCISEALLHTLTHCISDSACYATLHHPLHPHLCMCHLHLFVCLFAFVTSACVACFVCLFPLPDWFH